MKYRLDDRFVRDVAHPEEGQRLYFDSHPKAPIGFALRVTSNAKSWVLNYIADRKQRRLTLPKGYPAWGPARARIEAAKLKTEIHSGADPLAERRATEVAERKARESHAAKKSRTLGALLTLYADALERAGKVTAGKVRAQLRLHVEEAHPKLWKTPAADVRPEDGVEILSTLVEAGTLREAGKLRSSLRAAYSLAIRSRLDASASGELRALGIRANPFADLATMEGSSGGTRDRALSEAELRAYWQRIAGMSDSDGALLRLHLLTGGQRVDQLARAVVADIDREHATLTLWDKKGRRKTARRHVVPLLPEALDAIDAVAPARTPKAPYLLSIDGGRSGADYSSLRLRIARIAAAMVTADEASAPFTPGDLRRTVETRLEAAGVSREIRGHLQSHGLGGVQARHYERHDYLDEKRAALATLFRIASAPAAEVVPIKRHAR